MFPLFAMVSVARFTPSFRTKNVNRGKYIVYSKKCGHTYSVTYLLLDSIVAHNIHHHALK